MSLNTGSSTSEESVSTSVRRAPPRPKIQDLPEGMDPTKFSTLKKFHVVFVGTWFTANSAIGSSLPSGAVSWIADDFSVTNPTHLVLLNSLFLVGYSVGPLFLGPMSEYAGRSRVLLAAYVGYCIFTLACAVAPSYPALLIFRLLGGVNAACTNAVVGGLFADIYDEPIQRGRVLAYFMTATTIGPPLGPIISGFASTIDWRLTFWIGLALLGIGLPALITLPETQAEKTSRDDPDMPALTKTETLSGNIQVIFARPFTMIVREPVVLFSSLYMALVYSILYLFFQAYPIIFQGVYDMEPGFVGLAFLPVLGGSAAALAIFMWFSAYHAAALRPRRGLDASGRVPPPAPRLHRLSLSLFWLGWSSRATVHPVVPMMSGFLFGAGYLLIFMAMLNYLTDAYRQFSASAHTAASTTRSVCAVCLPLATRPMYARLGIAWACSLLGFVALAMAVIPFVFIRCGRSIRGRSPFCQQVLALERPADDTDEEEARGEELRSPGDAECVGSQSRERGLVLRSLLFC
ncbi:polyamine transporter 4 [Verticillium alfalfae VaMs.102]|uniref:Polyamine transporter 4 n=1 Tax=Verticillium alfalfae (strain VaMs.102 / ATCC MYA-4576 / FGSC 10136) TaxID=526221 RepID=C9SF72_VERA1|nr:polyamine transporter 4 [Verticillium alfalfae VaMs.102]EEY17858.1 polyamine transporter 4 [Verticillium alfalfae VaMs.102]